MRRNGYICRISEVASRELRNDTAGVLRRVEAGEPITITVKGKPVARLTAAAPSRRRWLSGVELARRLKRVQADPGLRDDLAEAGRRMGVNDLWIAAIAVSRGLPVITQDDDFAALEGVAGFTAVRV